MKLSPLKFFKNQEKTKIIEFLDHNLAWDILKLNNMIPRWLRESVIDWKIVMLYLSRNNFLTGTVFRNEVHGYPKV